MRWTAAAVVRAALLGLLWVFFAGWEADYAVYGAVAVAAATVLSLVLLTPQGRPKPAVWPRRVWFAVLLAAWFVGQSVRGGTDVALRALRGRRGIEPAVVEAGFQLPPGHARELALTMMNLMPGSMVQRVVGASGGTADVVADRPMEEPRHVELHTLSPSLDPAGQWAELQHRVRRAFE